MAFNKFISRFHDTADIFMTRGAFTKSPDTRTSEQLLANIDYFAERNPEVARFRKELKSMSPKHLSLVSDICELANQKLFLKTVDIKENTKDGKSLFAFLMEKLPKASKENPEALDFAQEVLNQTGSNASKYFLKHFAGIFEHPEISKHLAATRPLVKNIAEAALENGFYTMDYSKEQKFIDALGHFISPDADVKKIEMLPKIMEAADAKSLKDVSVYVDSIPFIHSKTPVKRVQENLQVFPEIAESLAKQTDEINITDFLVNNVNLD